MATDPDFNDLPEPAPKEAPEGTTLADMDEAKAAAAMLAEWDASEKAVRPHIEQGKLNRARELGFIGCRLVKQQDVQRFHAPMGATKNGALVTQGGRLIRRQRATMFADPPIPECTPSTDSDEDRDAAEFATRALQSVCSEGELDYALKAGDATQLGAVWGSGFIEFWVDPVGNGWVPQEVFVAATATTLQGAMDENGNPLDPATEVAWRGDTVTKYVRNDGTLSEDRGDPNLKQSWKPRVANEILTCKNVRLIPSTSRDIWEAEGVMIGRMIPLGLLKAMLPKLAELPPEELQRIAGNRPQHVKDLIPLSRRAEGASSTVTDETLVFVLRRYHRQCPAYPTGFHGLLIGTDHLYERGSWSDTQRGRPKDIPVTQFKQYQDGESGENPYGTGLMTFIGPLLEARAVLRGTLADHADKFRKRKTFIPTTSTLRPEQMMADAATYLPLMPGQEPRYEKLPDFPDAIVKMDAELAAEITDDSGLQAAAQGQAVPNTKSGLHYQTQIEQTIVGLSDLKANIDRGLTRGYRIVLQLISGFETPQKIQWVGDDGAYKEKDWTGADLGNTSDVRVSKGSFTGLAPSSKAQLTQSLQQAQLLTQEDAQHAIRGQTGGLIGLQDNPHEQRVRRQISAWAEGPPPDWQPPAPPLAPATQQPVVDPQTGQPAPAPPDPILTQIFAPLPCDEDPVVAKLRLYELGRGMAGTKFGRWPAPWQAGYVAEYQRMRQAAQVLDAQAVAKIQQDTQAQGEKLQATEQKLAAKPPIGLTLQSAMKLDPTQTIAFAAQAGIQLPPGGVQEPVLDPNLELQTQAQLQDRQIGADVEKHRTTESAKIERERIHAAAEIEKAKTPQPVTVVPS